MKELERKFRKAARIRGRIWRLRLPVLYFDEWFKRDCWIVVWKNANHTDTVQNSYFLSVSHTCVCICKEAEIREGLDIMGDRSKGDVSCQPGETPCP